MQENNIPCRNEHTFGGIVPTVDANKHEVQHPELMGKLCDCRRMKYNERKCNCGVRQWKIELQENHI